MEKTLVELLKLASDGDKEAFCEFIDRTNRYVWHILNKNFPDLRDESSDVFNSVYLYFYNKAQKKLIRATDDLSVFSYLRVVTRHLAIDHFRKINKPLPITQTDSRDIFRSLERLDFEQILSKYTDLEDKVFSARCAGKGFNEISQQLNIPYHQVRRIFKKLADAFLRELDLKI